MKQFIPFLSAIILFSFFACQSRVGETQNAAPKLLPRFQSTPLGDTVHFEVNPQAEASTANAIPNSIFYSLLDSNILRKFENILDTNEMAIFGKERYALNADFDACLLDVQQFWFRYKLLLIFDKKHNAFTDLVKVAEWYGGDGGQTLTGSWLFDFDGDGQKDLVLRQIDHSMHVSDEGEPQESNLEDASLLLWKNGSFVKSNSVDSSVLVKRFPIASPF